MTRITDLIGTGKTQITMDQVPAAAGGLRRRGRGNDAATRGSPAPRGREKGLATCSANVEMPLAPVLVAMERTGRQG
jgi:hypothetical protein